MFQPFQSTRPRGARRARPAYPHLRRRFNPRAREGRDVIFKDERVASLVSIHAPARGATLYHYCYESNKRFQSTRPRGARQSDSVSCLFSTTRFNPRAREGRDGPAALLKDALVCFNPRAREGRDGRARFFVFSLLCFNPRAREGRDLTQASISGVLASFNPRAREGRDDAKQEINAVYAGFNPRAREGRDRAAEQTARGVRVSIHAPARGATFES